MNGRVDTERHRIRSLHRPGLAFRMCANEQDGIGVGWILFDIARRDHLEGNAELLEDGAALRRGRCENERHHRLRATQISSDGHRRAHSDVTNG